MIRKRLKEILMGVCGFQRNAVVHGHWDKSIFRRKCSVCGGGGNLSPYDTPTKDFPYCPWCGAKMDMEGGAANEQ